MNDFQNITPENMPEIINCYDENNFSGEKPSSPIRQESHPEREILIVVSGNSSFMLNGKSRTTSPGDVFFIDKWIPHQSGYDAEISDFQHIWIHLHKDRIFEVNIRHADSRRTNSIRNWENSEGLLDFLNERWNRALQEKENRDSRRKIYLSIIRILLEEIDYVSSHPGDELLSKTEQITAWIKNYISTQYGRNASLPELEKLTGYNRFYLMRLFKAEYGMTIGDYINCVRCGFVENAKQKKLTQKEIASILGFSSPNAFWLWKSRNFNRSVSAENTGAATSKNSTGKKI